MRSAMYFLGVALMLPLVSKAQENVVENVVEKVADVSVDLSQAKTYKVEITELQVAPGTVQESDEGSQKELTPKQILESLDQLTKDGKLRRLEQIQLTVLSGQACSLKFGRQTAVTQGVTVTREGRMRSTSQIQIGTLIQLKAQPKNEKVLLSFKYESARLGEDAPEDTMPDIETLNCESSLLLQAGKPVILCTRTEKTVTYLLVSIDE